MLIGRGDVRHMNWRNPDERLKRLSKEIRQNYVRELRRLLDGARIQQHRVAIVVYGLINFESYFKGREAAERLRESDTTLYPHLETTYKYFISFHPDLPAQFGSACGDGERGAARNGGSVESRIRPSDRRTFSCDILMRWRWRTSAARNYCIQLMDGTRPWKDTMFWRTLRSAI